MTEVLDSSDRVYHYIHTNHEPKLSHEEWQSKQLLEWTKKKLAAEVGEGTVTLVFDHQRGFRGSTFVVIDSVEREGSGPPIRAYVQLPHQKYGDLPDDVGQAIETLIEDFAKKLRDSL